MGVGEARHRQPALTLGVPPPESAGACSPRSRLPGSCPGPRPRPGRHPAPCCRRRRRRCGGGAARRGVCVGFGVWGQRKPRLSRARVCAHYFFAADAAAEAGMLASTHGRAHKRTRTELRPGGNSEVWCRNTHLTPDTEVPPDALPSDDSLAERASDAAISQRRPPSRRPPLCAAYDAVVQLMREPRSVSNIKALPPRPPPLHGSPRAARAAGRARRLFKNDKDNAKHCNLLHFGRQRASPPSSRHGGASAAVQPTGLRAPWGPESRPSLRQKARMSGTHAACECS